MIVVVVIVIIVVSIGVVIFIRRGKCSLFKKDAETEDFNEMTDTGCSISFFLSFFFFFLSLCISHGNVKGENILV